MSFDDCLDEFFASYYRRRPVCATFIGVHDHDDTLPDYSPTARREKQAEIDDLSERLETYPVEDLRDGQQIDRKLAEGALRIQRWENNSEHYVEKNPAFYTGTAVFGVISIFLRNFAPVDKRVPDAISRMESIPSFLEQARENLGAIPAGWKIRASDECGAAITLFKDGLGKYADDADIDNPAFNDACDAAAAAFVDFRSFLERCEQRSDGHASGTKAFELLLSEGHQFELTTAELLNTAREEFERSRRYLDEHAADFGESSREDVLAKLEDSHPTVEEYYDRYRAVWDALHERVEEANVLTWPDYPITFVPRPEWVRDAAKDLYFLYYRAPAAFDEVAPIEYLVEPIEPEMDEGEIETRLRRNNDSQIKLNHVVHHGGIGHHVQNYRAYEQTRSRIGQMAAVDCASRVALYAGATMAEGWATYAAELADSLDFTTPLESYSMQFSRLRYAARTIVDIELHTGDMTYEDAVDFYRNNVGMSESGARYEATKNSMFPGMAVIYLHPLLTVHDLREEFEATLGSAFDPNWFHDELLSYGSIPVSVIAERMREEHLS